MSGEVNDLWLCVQKTSTEIADSDRKFAAKADVVSLVRSLYPLLYVAIFRFQTESSSINWICGQKKNVLLTHSPLSFLIEQVVEVPEDAF